MTHRFPIKEIARQAGLGTATVDRVLNNRAHVSPQTRNRVTAALRELKAQEAQLTATGRRVIIDVIAEAPQRFSREIRIAAETAARVCPGAAVRLRFLFQEIMTEAETLAALARIAKPGSDGICLKARDTLAVRGMIAELATTRIPVFTLVTDLPGSARHSYFGLDNAEAGRTAAYLLAQALPDDGATILTSRSQESFRGETDRYTAFQDLLMTLKPAARIIDASGGAGVTAATSARLNDLLTARTRIDGVYSMGGGNAAILKTMAQHGQHPRIFVAHDLDRENTQLLRQGAISFVLHHDLNQDLITLLNTAISGSKSATQTSGASSDLQIVTPYNLPHFT
ncbi:MULTISPECIES: LacI family DNA-binding transcriptional regulator [unclassified Yoonia]|uniref:LacI family DNA-binding transcriptional regulator n=1 Tax=unclassified Yoonia TaxID=2629118 RepID=UPI002AFDE481|nr:MULTISPECIES: LacI family DNA-binding transcriptional regulator [unclassified Yoonia]